MDPSGDPLPPGIGTSLSEGDLDYFNQQNTSTDAPADAPQSVQNDPFPLLDDPSPDFVDPLATHGLFTYPHPSTTEPVHISNLTRMFVTGPLTDYFACAIQCLLHSPPFASLFLNHRGAHRRTSGSEGPNLECIFCALEDLAKELLTNVSLPRVLKGVAQHIYSKIQYIFAPEPHDPEEQQDSSKFLKNFLLMLGTIETYQQCGLLSRRPLQEVLTSSIFLTCSYAGIYRTKCTSCDHSSTMSGSGFILPLQVSKGETLEDLIRVEGEEQELNSYKCSSCGTTDVGKKKFSMTRSPNVLILKLVRSGKGTGGKGGDELSLRCKYGNFLNISTLLEGNPNPNLEGTSYELTGLVAYKPQKLDNLYDWDDDCRFGRYACYVRSSMNRWTRKNEHGHKGMQDSKQVFEQNAFLLFYSRRGSPSRPPLSEIAPGFAPPPLLHQPLDTIPPISIEPTSAVPSQAPREGGDVGEEESFQLPTPDPVDPSQGGDIADIVHDFQRRAEQSGVPIQITPLSAEAEEMVRLVGADQSRRRGASQAPGPGTVRSSLLTTEEASRQVTTLQRNSNVRSSRFYRANFPVKSGIRFSNGTPIFEMQDSAEIEAEVELSIPDAGQRQEQGASGDTNQNSERTRSERPHDVNAGLRSNEGNNPANNSREASRNQRSNNEHNNNANEETDNNAYGRNNAGGDDVPERHPSLACRLRERRRPQRRNNAH